MIRTLDVGTIDVRRTLGVVGIYGADPTHRWIANGFAKAVLTPTGPGTIRMSWTAGGHLEAEAFGDGADWLLDQLPHWVGLHDDVTGFAPNLNPRVGDLWKRFGGFRLGRFGVIWQELVLVMLGQRVTTEEALRSWARMCRTWGEPAPGPDELLLPPTPTALSQINYTELHKLNVERRRAETIIAAAKRANRLEEAAAMSPLDAIARLTALPGLGAWTATATVATTHGAPDVVTLRDYGLPTLVNFAFTGDSKRLPPEPDGDRIMLEHLEPWAGHRQRIMRLLLGSDIKVPRRAARAFNPDIRRM